MINIILTMIEGKKVILILALIGLAISQTCTDGQGNCVTCNGTNC